MTLEEAARAVFGVFLAPQMFELGLEPLVHWKVHVAIHFDETGQEEKRALDALDQGKFVLVCRHGSSDVAAAAAALTIPERWGRGEHRGKGASPFLSELSR